MNVFTLIHPRYQLITVQDINLSQFKIERFGLRFRFVVFNANFNNISVISWQLVLLVEETEVSGENHRPVTSH